MEYLIELDQTLLLSINRSWTHPLLDSIFPVLTDLHRFPLGLLFLASIVGAWIWVQKKRVVLPILCLSLSILVSDTVTHNFIKTYFQRQRPEAIGMAVVVKGNHHSGYSFPSIHSSNMFAAATTLSLFYPPLTVLFYLFAGLIAYSRMYVGVHFPLDVLTGALWGSLVALIIFKSVVNSSLVKNSNLSS